MVLKNLPWVSEYLARTGYAGHLVRDLSNTHVMIVGGGTLLATGLCWLALPRVVGRPLASEGLAQCAFWFTVVGLAVFYVSLIGNGIAMGPLIEHGWTYPAAKAHMGNWYKAPTGMGAGVMGLGYWCFATNVCVTIFQSRLVRVPKPQWHLWKFFATGAAALTVGTVQGVIQVQPANANWLYKAGHAGEWIDPISHAHINLVTGLTMLVAGAFFALDPHRGRGRAVAAAAEHRLLRAARRLARLLLLDPLPRLPRGRARRPPRPHAGAGRGGDGAAPVPDHGLRDRDVRGVLAAARDDRRGRSGGARARCGRSCSRAARRWRSGRSRARCRRCRS